MACAGDDSPGTWLLLLGGTLVKVISGGQTGVDQGSLDAAIHLGLEHGGWCPKGRRAENGKIPLKYQLQEADDWRYEQRTGWNIRDSGATVVLTDDPDNLGPGSLLTLKLARKLNKSAIVIQLGSPNAKARLLHFIEGVQTVNFAGGRESSHPGIQKRTFDFLVEALSGYAANSTSATG